MIILHVRLSNPSPTDGHAEDDSVRHQHLVGLEEGRRDAGHAGGDDGRVVDEEGVDARVVADPAAGHAAHRVHDADQRDDEGGRGLLNPQQDGTV